MDGEAPDHDNGTTGGSAVVSNDERDVLRARVAGVLGPAGALIAFSWTAYRRRYPTHLAIKNAGVLDAASGEELWWGDLDVTRHGERVSEAARAIGRTLLLVYEGDRGRRGGRGVDAEFVVRAHPDGRLEPDARDAYKRRGRLYRQTPDGYARWRRRAERDQPDQLGTRERIRIQHRLAATPPAELARVAREERLAVTLSLEDGVWVLTIPALGFAGRGTTFNEALTGLVEALAASAEMARRQSG